MESNGGSVSLTLRPGEVAIAGDEVSLVARAQAGDEAAFALLVDQRRDQIYRTAWAILRNDADALDAAQETCINAWRELPRLRDPGRFDAWLTRSLVNRCRTMLRSRRRVHVRELPIDRDDALGRSASSQAGPEEYADSDAIRRAFERLTPEQRTYLVLHYIEGRSIGEIASIVGAPDGTVKWRLSEARKALERKLARERR